VPRPPIPPVAAAQVALGAAILAIHEMGREALSNDGAERIGEAAIAGVRDLLTTRVSSLQNELDELNNVLARFDR